ncbi:MAG: YlcI/YnfO family protein [Methyloligellaceae bacterium]
MSKSKILNIRIDPDMKKKAQKLAEEDGRTLSNWVTRLIEKELKKLKKASKEKTGQDEK